MSKAMKFWLFVATALILVGCMLFGGAMSVIKWDFSKLSTTKVETNTYEVTDEFKNISINTETADIVFLPSEDKKCKVVCIEEKNAKHSVKVENETLIINIENHKKWCEYIGVNFTTQKIAVYLPKSEFGVLAIKATTGDTDIPKVFEFESIDVNLTTGDVNCYASGKEQMKAKVSTGNILLEDISTKSLELSASTGDVSARSVVCDGDFSVDTGTGYTRLTDVECNNLDSIGTTGNLYLTNVIANSKLSTQRSTGDVVFENSDAQDIFIKATTGDVSGSILSNKIFITDVSTGNVNVPNTTTGGVCKITLSTGHVNITVIEN